MQDLTEVTQEVHYENYRSDRLAKGAPATTTPTSSTTTTNGNSTPPAETLQKSVTQKGPENERMIEELQEKEAQIKKMREMMAQMQAQLQDKK